MAFLWFGRGKDSGKELPPLDRAEIAPFIAAANRAANFRFNRHDEMERNGTSETTESKETVKVENAVKKPRKQRSDKGKKRAKSRQSKTGRTK